MKLSILILTIPERQDMLRGLITRLRQQIQGKPAQVLVNKNPTKSIGTKRNDLLKRAEGDYVVFIDDDDLVSPTYVDRILEAIETEPDCVGISGVIITNGQNLRIWHVSMDYDKWFSRDKVYYRTPNHLTPVKRSIALQAMFPEINYGEDLEYSQRLRPLIKTEVKIEGWMYTYRFIKNK